MKSALTEMQNQYMKLSYSERLFADYIFANRDQIIHMPIAELSQKVGIASSTVIAAIKKIGFSGYRDFKLALASELLDPINTQNFSLNGVNTTNLGLYQQVVHVNTTILNESLQNLSDIKFKEAASMLLQSDHIYIFGVGTSGVLAREAYDFLYRLGFQSTSHEDLHYQRLSANRVTSDSTALLISQSGVNKDIISLAEVLYNSPCKTIGISNYTGTPFCKYADLMLAPLTEPSNIHDNNFSFRIPILCILETLYYAIMEQLGDKKNPVLSQNHQLVQDHSINPLK